MQPKTIFTTFLKQDNNTKHTLHSEYYAHYNIEQLMVPRLKNTVF
jgi:hypothetical protein